MVSATTYTLVGVVNKFLTVLLNVVLWDKHSTGVGIFSVCICLLAGTLYQQAPRRDEVRKQQQQAAADQLAASDLESSSLIGGNNRK
jgi:solute carrier family 35